MTSAKGDNAQFEAALPENPQVRYDNGRQRGCLSCAVTPDTWTADLWFVDDVRLADSPVRRGASYVIRDGVVGAVPA